MSKPRTVIASAPEGEHLRARIADPPGCRQRVAARLRWLAARLPWLLAGALVGWLITSECGGLAHAALAVGLLDTALGVVVLVVVLAKG